jgi:parallel beta-helix repeat protein
MPRIYALVLSILTLGSVSGAATFAVDATVDDVDLVAGDGVCATAGGDCTLRAAVQETEALAGPDTITLPAGTYVLTIPRGPVDELLASKGDLDVQDELTVNGAGTGLTVIDANDVDRVFQAFNASLAVNDLTIRNGNGLSGGGVFNSNSAVVLTNVVITDCRSFTNGLAGAIMNSGTLQMTSGALTGNRAGEGGAVFMNAGSSVFVDVTIAGNHADTDGGAIKYHAPATSMTITGCTISDNVAEDDAGGIVFSDSTLTMANSTVSGNRANLHAAGSG